MELLFLLFGIGFGYFIFRTKQKEKAPFPFEEKKHPEEEEPDSMTLRNGYSVTRCKNPTFAEQIVNIANFKGENQKEEDYEET